MLLAQLFYTMEFRFKYGYTDSFCKIYRTNNEQYASVRWHTFRRLYSGSISRNRSKLYLVHLLPFVLASSSNPPFLAPPPFPSDCRRSTGKVVRKCMQTSQTHAVCMHVHAPRQYTGSLVITVTIYCVNSGQRDDILGQ